MGTAVTKATDAPVTIASALQQAMPRITTLLDANPEKAKRIVAIVRTEVAKKPELNEAEPYSVVQSVCDAVAIGLTPGSLLGEAYLVVFAKKCQCIPGYRGYVKLALKTGEVVKLEARLVYRDDEFSVEEGTTPKIVHRPALFSERRTDEDILAAYAVAHLKNSAEPQFRVMTRDEILKRKAASRGSGRSDSPWVQWFPEQCMKTAVRALAKLLPLSDEFRAAEELDNRYDVGVMGSPLPHETPEEVQARVVAKTADRAAGLRAKLAARPHHPECVRDPNSDAARCHPDCPNFNDEETNP